MSRVTGVRQTMLVWGARAACSGAVDCLCRCAPPADTAPLRSLAPCLPYRSGSKQPTPIMGVALTLPLRFAPLRLLGLSRATSPRAPCSSNDALCLPYPLAVTPPTIGAG